ncbi:HAD hydrolase family protein [Methanoplanus endosymbiosus]|uniref:HAD hydrolase family protein n=1 Tax=Methanoplanus endosymbiosus TaxID=33865 RepID=A0A9E7TK16_9EURY|nr:HAD hydrolase family protein [Methanoplanus endosymbiosus]UUX92265.1 HAD hydrolase family protein [Methanoplanus endosymbiosus]
MTLFEGSFSNMTITNNSSKLQHIRAIFLDCDGVLTDGSLYYGSGGETYKKFNVKDGLAIKEIIRAGFYVFVISGRKSESLSIRCNELGITGIHQNISDKLACAKEICSDYDILLSEVIYMGDDLNDLELLQACGFSIAPADAAKSIKSKVDYICKASGGKGVVAEIANEFLQNQRVEPSRENNNNFSEEYSKKEYSLKKLIRSDIKKTKLQLDAEAQWLEPSKLQTVVDIMQTIFPHVDSKDDITQVLKKKSEGHKGLVLIINNESELLGIVADDDIHQYLQYKKQKIYKLNAADIMNSFPIVFSPNDTIQKVIDTAGKTGKNIYPIVNRDNIAIGIVNLIRGKINYD